MTLNTLFLALAMLFCGNVCAQGTSCASPIPVTVDGILRTYPASASVGANVLCTNNGTTPVTWFSFTSDALGSCPLFSIAASDAGAMEIALYTSCASMLTTSSMCMYDGFGLWAPNENLVIAPSTTYFLRIKTSTACNINISAQNYLPPNGNCLGAVSLGAQSINDNNACHHAATNITPAQACAITLENTAWYTFYVATTGYSIITISNIHCNNGAANNNSGFQVGFFTGNCSGLVATNCSNGSGATVQATTTLLQAGTQVFVAIDGISGSNCTYTLSGVNTSGVLAGNMKHFSGWKSARSNILQWTILSETEGNYTVESSIDGNTFRPIGEVECSKQNLQNVSYRFEDKSPALTTYYRLRKITASGKIALSNTISIARNAATGLQLNVKNPAFDILEIAIAVEKAGRYQYTISNAQGQLLLSQNLLLRSKQNEIAIPIGSLASGQYFLTLGNGSDRASKTFIKNRN